MIKIIVKVSKVVKGFNMFILVLYRIRHLYWDDQITQKSITLSKQVSDRIVIIWKGKFY